MSSSAFSKIMTNLQNRLSTLSFEGNLPWDNHVSDMMEIFDDLVSYDLWSYEPRSSKAVTCLAGSHGKQFAKLIRSLPQSLEPFAIVSNMASISFDELLNSVHVEIARRESHSNKARPVSDAPPPYARFSGRFNDDRYRGCVADHTIAAAAVVCVVAEGSLGAVAHSVLVATGTIRGCSITAE